MWFSLGLNSCGVLSGTENLNKQTSHPLMLQKVQSFVLHTCTINIVFKSDTIIIDDGSALMHYCHVKLADYIGIHSGCFSLKVLWNAVLIYTHYCIHAIPFHCLKYHYSFLAVVTVAFWYFYSSVFFSLIAIRGTFAAGSSQQLLL